MLLKLKVEKRAPEPVVEQQPAKLELHGADEQLAGGGFQTEKREQQSDKETESPTPTKLSTNRSIAPSPISSGVKVTVRGPGAKVAQPLTPNVNDIYAKVGRNDQCPCGSGKKFKKCHGK